MWSTDVRKRCGATLQTRDRRTSDYMFRYTDPGSASELGPTPVPVSVIGNGPASALAGKRREINMLLTRVVLVTLLIVTLAHPGPGHAVTPQPATELSRLCVHLGLNRSHTTNETSHSSEDAVFPSCLRGGLGIFILDREQISLLVLASYDQRRGRGVSRGILQGPDRVEFVDYTHEVAIDYLVASAIARYAPFRLSIVPFVGAGPEFGIPIAAHDRIRARTTDVTFDRRLGILGGVTIPDVALRIESGVEIPDCSLFLVPTVSYIFGLRSIGGDDGHADDLIEGLGEAQYRVLGLSLGIHGR